MKRWLRRFGQSALAASMVAGVLTACSSGSGKTPTLNWYINPDNGGQVKLAAECSASSHGAYKIKTFLLPTDATLQRQQLVTRLSAKDSSITMMSLDPVYVPEFAEAGFLTDVPQNLQAGFTQNIVQPAVDAAKWGGKLVAAPFWANVQLLWYRKSVAKAAGLNMNQPVTWAQLITAAKSQHKSIGVQADVYEGYTVWINALILGAGGQIVDNPGAQANHLKLGLNTQAGKDAANIISTIAHDNLAGPAMSTAEEAQSLALFEQNGASGFLVNWPYVWNQLTSDKVKFKSDVGFTLYPETVAGTPSKPPFGGIEEVVSKYAKHKAQAWQAIQCITSAQHQADYMVSDGNPAANTTSYQTAEVLKAYPDGLAQMMLKSVQVSGPRPQSQYYGDLSAALQKAFSPPNSVSSKTPAKAQKYILQVLKGDKLL